MAQSMAFFLSLLALLPWLFQDVLQRQRSALAV
jgi:hypothetical protein